MCPFPGTRVWSYTTVNKCARNRRSSLPLRPARPGAAEPTKTRTGCSGSTFNQGIDSRCTARPAWTWVFAELNVRSPTAWVSQTDRTDRTAHFGVDRLDPKIVPRTWVRGLDESDNFLLLACQVAGNLATVGVAAGYDSPASSLSLHNSVNRSQAGEEMPVSEDRRAMATAVGSCSDFGVGWT